MGKETSNYGKGKAKGKGSSRKSGRQNEEKPPVASKCYNQAVFYMKQMLNVVANFDKQYKRIKAQTKTGGNKADKKGAFAAIAANLVNIGGGNKDKLSCAGSDSNDGAKQLSNLTSTLFDCEKMINDSCNSNNFPQSNMTLTDECVKNTKMFSDTVKTCLKEATDEGACKCWTNPELEKTSMAIKDCKMSDQASAVKNKLDECKKAFGKCRKYQDAAGDAISACSQETSKLTKDAAKLNSNKNAMEKASAKIKALASLGIGRRSVRQVATSCAQVIAKAAQLTAVATANPSGDQVATLANEISEVSATVECNAVEKISLTVTSNALDIAIAIVTTAFNAIQNLIATIVGTPAPPSSLTTGSSSATAASSGRRERLYKDLMIKNMI